MTTFCVVFEITDADDVQQPKYSSVLRHLFLYKFSCWTRMV